MSFSAVILAGGKSSRMGRDKAWLETGGQTLLARRIDIAREIGAVEIFISGRTGEDYSAFGCRVLQDKFPDAGPFAGIERALDAAKSPMLLVLAVDLPEMSAEFLRLLAASCSETCGAITKLADHIKPLATFYPKVAHQLAVTCLERGALAVKDFAGECVQAGLVRFVGMQETNAKLFANWNSPADLASTTRKIVSPHEN